MSESTVDIKAIINEVARRHNIRLAPDDPILATVTVTEIVHKLFAEHLTKLVEGVANQATDRLTVQIEIGRREVTSQCEAAKSTASKLINDAGAWSADNLKQASAGAADDIQAAITSALSTIELDIREVHKAKAVATWAAIVAVLVGGAFLGGGIGLCLAGHCGFF
jgi:hypothetical protein